MCLNQQCVAVSSVGVPDCGDCSMRGVSQFTTIQAFSKKSHFLARDAYATMSVSVCLSVCLSVTEVHWRIIANLGFKFRSTFTTHCGRGACREEGRDHRREEWRDHLALC